MKLFKKIISACSAALLMLSSTVVDAQFLPAIVNKKYFPKPINPVAVPASTGRPSWPTFYNQRNNGSCYNTEVDITGDLVPDEVYVWAIHWDEVSGYSNAIAYEIINGATGLTQYRGTKYLGADIANINVGAYKLNGSALHIIAAYWNAGGMPLGSVILDDFAFSTSLTPALGGLTLASSTVLYNMINMTGEAMQVTMDCHDNEIFTIGWEDRGVGVFLQGFDKVAGTASPIMAMTSPTFKLPDLAMSHNPSLPSGPGGTRGKIDVHLALADAGPTAIVKYVIDFDAMMIGGGVAISESVEPFPVFGPYWDDFMMKIDAPDHYTALQPDWSYVYFADDNNKINTRICNRATSSITTYTVNDGSVPLTSTGSGLYLPNITNAGNAFPTITYHPTGSLVYIGWYTNYDPAQPAWPAPNNPLYTYTSSPGAGTQGYVSVVMDITGFLRTSDYNRVDEDYQTNRVGNGIDPINPWTDYRYPKVCFSKHNDGNQLFTVFSSHDFKPDLIWGWGFGLGGSAFLGKYFEVLTMGSAANEDIPNNRAYYDIGYAGLSTTVINPGTSVFLSQKQVNWYPTSPLFRTTKQELIVDNTFGIKLLSNPFTNASMFQLKGGDAKAVYNATLLSIDGKQVSKQSGTIEELNNGFKSLGQLSLSSGAYQLSVSSGKFKQNFNLIKQ